MVSLAGAWREGRTQRAARPARQSVVVRLAIAAGRRLPTWKRVRTAALTVVGLGFIDYALWSWHAILGYAAVGVSLLILEALGGER